MSRQPRRRTPNRGTPQRGSRETLVVGIGASAGGLDPLKEFFQHLPAGSGLFFLVVQHLGPSQPSMLVELLGRCTSLPVLAAADGIRPEPDHVYVITPGTLLTMDKGVLRVAEAGAAPSLPIDALFHSLAREQGDHAVGILFSGSGHDGTPGLRAIKEHGGLTLAQPPETAQHDSMPQSAIDAGLVDHVLPADRMPAKLAEHAEHLAKLVRADADRSLDGQLAAHLAKICSIIHQRTGHDFSRYKQGTLLRRIRRRIQVQQIESVEGYLHLLEKDAAEAEGLLKDLLIGVTQFFRDPDAFQTLAQQVLPLIAEGKAADAPIRVWVPGCASGEEAYSIAILLREHLDRLDVRRFVQIFATDLDVEMLAEARQGRYPADIAEQLSPERLARFFVREDQSYQAIKELREMCVFSEHSLIRDPPFSQLDLISCRNVLIYLGADLQKKLVPLFHYALRPGGFLFLGPSEGIAGSPELFEPADQKHRIFRRKETVIRPVVEFPLVGRSPTRTNLGAALPSSGSAASTAQEKIGVAFERALRDEYTFPSAVINERGDALFVAGPLSRYLQLPAGAVSMPNLLEVFRGTLRQELRLALRTAKTSRQRVVRDNVQVEVDDSIRTVRLTVRPMRAIPAEVGLFLVVIQESAPFEPASEAELGVEQPAVEQLESELRETRGELKTAVEELESANEELKSSNEEMISTNEELQSANEELQTAKEEQQSVNEELETVNSELREKVDELAAANSDLQNLFAATEIATIFLDRSLRVGKFTPAATALFHLIETDVGRPIADFAQGFVGQDLVADAQQVLRLLTPIERQVRSAEGGYFVLRVVPYRTTENFVAGVVVTFVDVTSLKRAEEEVRRGTEREHFLAEVIENASTPFGVGAPDGSLLLFNRAFAELTGYSREELEQRRLTWATDLTPPEWREREAEILGKASQTGETVRYEKEYIRKDGSRVPVELSVQPVLDNKGHVIHYRSFVTDISARKQAEAEQAGLARQRQLALDAAAMGWWHYDPVTQVATYDKRYTEIFGVSGHERANEEILKLLHPDDLPRVWAAVQAALDPADPKPYSVEYRVNRLDGEMRWVEARGLAVFAGEGDARRATSLVGTVADITERKQAEASIRQAHGRTAAILESIADAFYSLDAEWRFVMVNPAAERAPFGRPASELIGKVIWDVFPKIPGTRIHQHYLDAVAKRSHEHYEAPSPLNGRWYEVFMFPRTGGLDVYLRDIDDRKKAEAALKESEERFRTIAETLPVLVSLTRTEDSVIVFTNTAYNEAFGFRKEEIIGRKGPEVYYDPADRERMIDTIKEQGFVSNYQLKAKKADGKPMWLLSSVRPIVFGGKSAILGASIDISERKQAEEALHAANLQLAEADRGKNEFLAVLSHELRNPLSPIRNSLFILEHTAPGGEQSKRALDVIGRQVSQLARLVDDLLDLTRVSRNKIQLQRRPLELNNLVRRTVDDHHSLFEEKGIIVEMTLAPERLPVDGDVERLAQVVGNLLHNAAKFTPTGGRVRVGTAAVPSRSRATLRVIDTGVGIEPTMLGRLFEPFIQADATLDRSQGGLGLGLALVKGLVEMHGGEVCAHSDGPGKGAEFVVEFPLDRTARADLSPAAVGTAGKQRRVLIIEDNRDAADSLREVLQFGGHSVEVAYNGPDGLDRARGFNPEIVLCDIGLPGMDGYEVARAFRADEALKGVFLVALSGYALPDDLQRAQEAGFEKHLAKPSSLEKLEELLAEAPLDSPRQRIGRGPDGNPDA